MNLMNRLALVAVTASMACQPAPRSGTLPSLEPAPATAAPGPSAPPAPAPSAAELAAMPAAERTAALEARVARLEADAARNAEALEFLRKVFEQQKTQVEAQARNELAEDGMYAVEIADSVKAGQVEGPASAPITIVKAFDFACPYCYQAAPTMDALIKDYKGKVRVVYLNMIVHESARPAHLASCAAARQGKYLEFKRAFWDQGFAPYAASQGKDPAPLGEDNILAIAKGVGLDPGKLKVDMASPACAARVAADADELAKFHVSATPTFFINGKHIGGALPKEAFVQLVDEQLKLVTLSGVPGAEYYKKVVLAKGEKQFRSKLDPKPR